jgi:hypothetical protein
MEKLPIYEIIIDENDEVTGVDFISLVDEPATDFEWIKFEKDKLLFKADKKKKMMYGVLIVPDKKIYRETESMGEYLTFFSKETIQKIVKKFNKNNYNKNINFQHGDNKVDGYLVENFITSDNIKVDFGFEVPDGSWIGSVYIEDDDFWNSFIETDSLRGFSVEIVSQLVKQDFMKFESYIDYPKAATENAKTALRWVEKNGWGDCGTAVGKVRANQLANREPISEDTIARMAAFARHKQNSDRPLGEGCGRLMWLCWGGDAGIEWASRKLKQIRKEELSEDERYETMLEILNSDFEKNNKIEDLKNLLK